MTIDAQTIRQDAVAQGWVARAAPFEPEVPIGNGVEKRGRRFLSWLFKGEPDSAYRKRPGTPGASRPSVVDWRERSVIAPAGHQQDVTACVSYATCAAADARNRMAGRAPVRLAPRYLHFCLMKLDRTNGADIELLAETVLADGLPYDTGDTGDMSSRKSCLLVQSPDRLGVAALYKFTTAEEAKRELAEHGPLIAQMELREDFMKWYESGVYRPTAEPADGSHAVTLIGYDDQRGYWIGVNSLGPDWGEGGFFRLAYGTSGLLTGADPAFSLDLS